jgi:Mlc titration factor MtfA (ptsG expression regulator)
LIAASAIKVSFGYRNYLFSIVDTIIVYPKDYFSNITNQQHKGETNPRYKTVVFSWKDFKEGLKIENDNLNLGLHEFTHAMQFSFKHNQSSSSRYFKRNYNNLLYFLEDKNEQNKLIDSGYIREYAFENQYEFLAVLVEHYFETPKEFKAKLPEIFEYMSRILNIEFEN